MKVLNIDTKVEQSLVQIFDSALKGAGWQVKQFIDLVQSSIVEKTEEVKECQ